MTGTLKSNIDANAFRKIVDSFDKIPLRNVNGGKRAELVGDLQPEVVSFSARHYRLDSFGNQ